MDSRVCDQFTAFVGIDWADTKHDFCLQAADGEPKEFGRFAHQVVRIEEWAAKTITRSFWAGAYYRQQRDQGKSHQAAVRALAFKWIRILYRCWQNRTPYNESTYLIELQRRGSPLLNQPAETSQNA